MRPQAQLRWKRYIIRFYIGGSIVLFVLTELLTAIVISKRHQLHLESNTPFLYLLLVLLCLPILASARAYREIERHFAEHGVSEEFQLQVWWALSPAIVCSYAALGATLVSLLPIFG